MAVKKSTTEKKKPVKKTAKKVSAVKETKVVPEKKAKEKKVAVETAKKEIAPKATKAEKREIEVKPAVLEKYLYAVGRRKSSVAQVRIFEDAKATDADLLVNGKKLKEYFPMISLQNNLLSPLKAAGAQGKFRMSALVRGGGVTGQVEAIRLGIARALVKHDESLKKSLKDLGLMTRDSREVERKKAGLKKARKAPQWAKR